MNVVISDFGSTGPLKTKVSTRSEALLLQEDAAVKTTASIRPPELYDCPSEIIIDGKVDVWGIGCALFHMLFSRNPFESPLNGLSTLAVISGNYSIPSHDSTYGGIFGKS